MSDRFAYLDLPPDDPSFSASPDEAGPPRRRKWHKPLIAAVVILTVAAGIVVGVTRSRPTSIFVDGMLVVSGNLNDISVSGDGTTCSGAPGTYDSDLTAGTEVTITDNAAGMGNPGRTLATTSLASEAADTSTWKYTCTFTFAASIHSSDFFNIVFGSDRKHVVTVSADQMKSGPMLAADNDAYGVVQVCSYNLC